MDKLEIFMLNGCTPFKAIEYSLIRYLSKAFICLRTLLPRLLAFFLLLTGCDNDKNASTICVPEHVRAALPGMITEMSTNALQTNSLRSDQRKRRYHIVLDRSMGMSGFVRSPAGATPSEFSRTLDELPSVLTAQADFGGIAYYGVARDTLAAPPEPLNEKAFRQAVQQKEKDCKPLDCQPYKGSGLVAPILQKVWHTQDLPAGEDDVVILITDLQPDDQDAPGDGGKIGLALREIVQNQGRAVGIIGIRSRFVGKVFDLPGGGSIDRLEGAQPFFIILLGPKRAVARLQNSFANEFKKLGLQPDGPNPTIHTQTFAQVDGGIIEAGGWKGRAPSGSAQLVMPDAKALSLENGQQFLIPRRVATPGDVLAEFAFSPKVADGTNSVGEAALHMRSWLDEPPQVRVWAPTTSVSPDCSHWKRIAGTPLVGRTPPDTNRVQILMAESDDNNRLPPGFVYLVEMTVTLAGEQREKLPEWARAWTVSGSWQDEYNDLRIGKRDVLGVANLDRVMDILSKAEVQSNLAKTTNKIVFAFRLGS
jgi:hypothetical protein